MALSDCDTLQTVSLSFRRSQAVKEQGEWKVVPRRDIELSLARMSELREVTLQGSKVSSVRFEDLPKVEAIIAYYPRKPACNVDVIRGVPHLKRLEIPGAAWSDDDVRELARANGLEVLDLSGSDVTDAGVEHLATCTKLQRLSLADTAVTDACLAVLNRMPNLSRVDLQGTQVREPDALQLRGRR